MGNREWNSGNAEALREVSEVLDLQQLRRDHLIEYLHRIQDHFGGVSHRHLNALAAHLSLTPVEVFEVASFYHAFHLDEKDKNRLPVIDVCDSLCCDLAGGELLIRALEDGLAGSARVRRIACLGRCIEAPAVRIAGQTMGQATMESVSRQLGSGVAAAASPAHSNLQRYRDTGGYDTWLACIAGILEADEVIGQLEQAGLRGLGGAGFPTARKWRAVRSQPGAKSVVVNIDESEPGTCKDRHILLAQPHSVLEGALIAATTVGAEAVYLYLRDEYADCREVLGRSLAELRSAFPDQLPHIELRRGAGNYICGEESALIESLEGKRGMPRLRPPFVAEVGLFGRPTLVNNLETLSWVPTILRNGPEAYTQAGRNGRQGLRTFTLSGRVASPGVYEAPAGITLRELVDEYGGGMAEGHELYAYLPGGASGGVLPARLAEVPLDFDTLAEYGCFIGSYAVIVLSQQDSVRAAALNVMRFFERESCGQCTPCRVGTHKAVGLLQQEIWDEALLEELAAVMTDGSICGLGQAAPNVLRCALKYFPQEFGRE